MREFWCDDCFVVIGLGGECEMGDLLWRYPEDSKVLRVLRVLAVGQCEW